jgi:hypothetical protein
MSSSSSQFNWGAGYLASDLYLRFINPKANHKAQLLASRISTLLLAALGLIASRYMTSISGVWELILQAGAGTGLVLIVRWYWWRVNAWSEITATLTPILVYILLTQVKILGDAAALFPNSFFITVATTTVAWITVTFLTPPESQATLLAFYRRVRPEAGWEPIRKAANLPPENGRLGLRLICWVAAIGMGYSTLFATGSALFQRWNDTLLWSASLAICLTVFVILIQKGKALAPTDYITPQGSDPNNS